MGRNCLSLLCLKENQHWNQLIQDAQKRGAIIKTCDKNYRHDAAKILKLKPVLQRSLTHPPAGAPEMAWPQGGLPGSKPDGELARTSSSSSLYHVPSDSKESAGTVTAKDPERPPIQDRLRDPRLLRRLGLDPEAKGTCPWDPQPLSPQHPGATPPLGEPGFPSSHQDLGGAQPPAARGATLGTQKPVQREPLAAGTEASASKRTYDWEGGVSHRRETRAFSEGDREPQSPESRHVRRRSGWDHRRLEGDDGGSKKRRFL